LPASTAVAEETPFAWLAAYEDAGASDVALDIQSRHVRVNLRDEPGQHRNSGFDFRRSLSFEATQFGEGLGIPSERLMRTTDVVENNWITHDRVNLGIGGDGIGVPESIKMLVTLRLELGGASNIGRCSSSGLGQCAGRAGKHGEDYRAKNEQSRYSQGGPRVVPMMGVQLIPSGLFEETVAVSGGSVRG
jgi:hypothetical protein